MKILQTIPLILFATVLLPVMSCNKDDDNDKQLSTRDNSFMMNAAYANHNEVDFAQLALTKSSNDSVRIFAAKIELHSYEPITTALENRLALARLTISLSSFV